MALTLPEGREARLPTADERRERVGSIASSWHERAQGALGARSSNTMGTSPAAIVLQKLVPSLHVVMTLLAPASANAASPTAKKLRERAINISESSSTNLMHSIRSWRYKRQLYEAVRLLAQCSPQPDSLVVHSEPFDSKLVRIAASGGAPSAFCAVDATKLIERWADFRFRSFGELQAEVRVRSTGDYVLMCLMAQLQVALRVESLADIAVVQRAMRHITQKVPRGSAASVSRSLLASVPVRDFGSLFMWDACVVRSPSHITASLRAGIRTFLIDDEDEAARIQHAHKRLEQVGSLNFVVLLRSCASQSVSGGASIPLMYGCEPKALAGMAARLKSRHAAVVGLCMHVHVQDMGAVLRRVGEAVEALSTHTHQVQFVCLHGDGEDSHSLVSTSSSLSAMRNFRARYRIPHVLCDATRFLFEGSHTVVARVIGHKPAYDESGCVCGQQYFIDDGCYSSFCRTSLPSDVTSGLVSSAQLFPRPTALVRAPTGASCPPEQTCETTVWGQTCDSIDCVVRHARLPSLGTGSWVAFPHMEEACGGYETRFNGFEPPSKRYFVRLT